VLWFFCFVPKFFFQTTRVRIFFFVTHSANFFFQNLTLSYMTKILNQIIFSSSTKIRIFFSATLGIFFFRKKPYPPPPLSLQVKWVVPNQMYILYIWVETNLCFPFVDKCTRFNIMWSSLSVTCTCDRPVVFSGFLHQ
jgi:hypothetical protein